MEWIFNLFVTEVGSDLSDYFFWSEYQVNQTRFHWLSSAFLLLLLELESSENHSSTSEISSLAIDGLNYSLDYFREYILSCGHIPSAIHFFYHNKTTILIVFIRQLSYSHSIAKIWNLSWIHTPNKTLNLPLITRAYKLNTKHYVQIKGINKHSIPFLSPSIKMDFFHGQKNDILRPAFETVFLM